MQKTRHKLIAFKMLKLNIFLLGLLALAVHASKISKVGDPTVTLPSGTIKGTQIRDRDYDNTIERYLGIPYAEPPVGDLRFKPSVIYTGSGTIDGSQDFDAYNSKMCVQADVQDPTSYHGSEDCLYLNVWVPDGVYAAREEVLPVVVFIHGGLNVYGSSWGPTMYNERVQDMQKLALHGNVIAVSINYRLGPFGFLSTGDDSASGNYGLLDQNLALQWIQENIWAFGGDPNQITIFGQESGGVHATMHMMSAMSTPLFNRVIAESGSALSPWAVNYKPLDTANKLADAVGCSSISTLSMIACLQTVDAGMLATALVSYSTHIDSMLNVQWAPVVDGSFLTAPPAELVSSIGYKDLLIGNNDMDGHLFASIDYPEINNALGNMDYNSLVNASRQLHANTPQQVSDAIVYEYMKYTDGLANDYYTVTLVYLYTDYLFTSATYSMASEHAIQANTGGGTTFSYIYAQPASFSIGGGIDPTWLSADHDDEVPLVFGMPQRAGVYYNKDEEQISSAMMTYWTNFVWSGNPNGGPTNNVVPTYWNSYDISTQQWLKIDSSLIDNPSSSLLTTYRAPYTAFWTRMVPQLLGSSAGACNSTNDAPVGRTQLSYGGTTEKSSNPDISETCGSSDDWVRVTEYGCVRGDYSTWNGQTVGRYRGLRYAAVQSNVTRFMKPSSPSYFSGIADALAFSKMCPQGSYDSSTMDEDCLFLNIYVPTDSSANNAYSPGKYAIMVWFHEGSYMSGSASDYDGTVLAAQENIIVVTINYRLGSLGFLSSGDRYSKGDWGLWDQNLALSWVKDNIEYFSGDSSRITLAGSGAGSEMVHLQTLSAETESLKLTQAILQSGTAFTLDSYPQQSNQALQLATRVGCASISIIGNDQIDCLRTISVADLMTAQKGNKALSPLQFAAVIDGDFINLDPLIDIDIPSIRSWSYIMGFNNGDGTDHWDEISIVEDGNDFAKTIKSDFKSQFGLLTDDIQFQYTSWENPSFTSDQTNLQENLLNVFTDYKYVAPTTQLAFIATTTAILPTTLFTDVWMYYLTLPYKTSEQLALPTWAGTMHGADIAYVWGEPLVNSDGDSNSVTLSTSMMKYWGNFIKTGTPNKDENGDKTSFSWSKYQDRSPDYINFDANLSIDNNLKPQEVVFWNEFLYSKNVTCEMPFM